ncbi:MAG TPA: glycosyltransferase family 2 protein [Terriglobales bacterium]|nr:glycosyltransferase family 2 protein [Terriglobales bacterium]
MLSVVVPIYNEEENIYPFHHSLTAVLEDLDEDFEIVFVNDGSRDNSLPMLLELGATNRRIIVVELSRNFGHQAALSAGLNVAKGDAVILMDGDFQDPPSVVPRLVESWRGGAKVVIANRASRAEKGIRGKLFPLFYKVMGWVSDFPIPLNAGIFGLLDRQAVDAINRLHEGNRYLPGMRSWIGFPTAFVSYDRADRAAGEPKQSFLRLFKYAADAIFSFSYKPLRLGMALGGLVLAFSIFASFLAIAAVILHLKLFGAMPDNGFLGVSIAVLFLGGVQLICVGLLGEYIGRIYDEVRKRPLFLIHQIHRGQTQLSDENALEKVHRSAA